MGDFKFIFVHFTFLTVLFLQSASAQDNSLINCNQIFEQRKGEIKRELELIDERQQAFEALSAATKSILEQKEVLIAKKEVDLNTTLNAISQKEEEIKKILAQNSAMLEAIKKAKDDKIGEAYVKMKDGAAAEILQNTPFDKSASILFNLPAAKISKILSKMDPKKASEVTLLLKKGPPFDDNSTQNKN